MSIATDSLLRLSEVLKQTGISKSQTYLDIKLGLHPEPIRKGRISLWSQNEINAYIEDLKAGQRGVLQETNVKNSAQIAKINSHHSISAGNQEHTGHA